MHAPQVHLGELSWQEALPTKSGDYFIAQEGCDTTHKLLTVDDQGVYWTDDDWDNHFFAEGCGWLFLGPVIVIPPTHYPAVTREVIADASQGNQTDV